MHVGGVGRSLFDRSTFLNMYSLRQCISKSNILSLFENLKLHRSIGQSSTNLQRSTLDSSNEFRVLDLKKRKTMAPRRRPATKPLTMPPRSESMPVDQDWVSIWPGPRTFHPASVPLPLRQGYPNKEGEAPPGKFGNAELMKIPNFLHLTPPAIHRHCEALKKFCTPWPSALNSDADCERIFPIEVSTDDFCNSSPSIRNPLARIVKLSSLQLDDHARDKFLRLVAERYDPETDTVMILTDRCPTRKQNKEYARFLLAALYHESWKVEPWEKEKSEADMEMYDWQTSASRATIDQLASRKPDLDQELVPLYATAVTKLIDEATMLSAVSVKTSAQLLPVEEVEPEVP
ncbi:hypothetical protein B566_EDAN001769 [Ephemera danica]|nr:hypothetical protein B566_EDAN001769 [Ephemera danica]